MHNLVVKFVPAYLPEAKKPYNIKAVHQTVMTVHDVASKADVYNTGMDPLTIEQGTNAFFEMAYYLTMDGVKIVTPFFSSHIRLPGEYDGTETRMADGCFPSIRVTPNPEVNHYAGRNMNVVFSGKIDTDGRIGRITDEKTGLVDSVITIDEIVTIQGTGMKIDGDAVNADKIGLFICKDNTPDVRVTKVVVNEPQTLKIIVPTAKMEVGEAYTLKIVTQTSAQSYSHLVKELRTVTSEFTVTARN
jgi:hypothetical protein